MKRFLKNHYLLKLVAVIFVFSITIGCLVFGIIYFSGFLNDGEGDGSEKVYEYRYLHHHLDTNETDYGFVSMPQYLSDGFISFSESSTRTLISNFGSEEYHCTGSCYCGDDTERRVTGSVSFVKRGLIALVAGITSLVAYEKAKEIFEDECGQEYSESCPPESIVSQVDVCEPFLLRKKKKLKGKVKEKKQKGKLTKLIIPAVPLQIPEDERRRPNGEYREYLCKANCLPKKNMVVPEAKKRAKSIDCEKLILKEEVHFFCRYNKDGKMINDENQCIARAKQKFTKLLTPFCKINSKFKLKYKDDSNRKIDTTFVACASRPWLRGMNPTTNCFRIDDTYVDV